LVREKFKTQTLQWTTTRIAMVVRMKTEIGDESYILWELFRPIQSKERAAGPDSQPPASY
jgi:hypothetical protein